MKLAVGPNGLESWHFALGGPTVLAAVTTRRGGVSRGVYESLNLAFHVDDDPRLVVRNRDLVCHALGTGPLTAADQRHGRGVAYVGDDLAGAGHGSLEDGRRLGPVDALVTDRPGVTLSALVADCAPVVLYDPDRRVLGVAHAGRPGVVADVLGATVGEMSRRFGTDPADLLAGVGPCVGPDHYEIGGTALDDVRAAFGERFLQPTGPGHARFDLPAAVTSRLLEAGVKPERIEGSGVDTYTAEALFSDRRARPCGRFMLVAALR